MHREVLGPDTEEGTAYVDNDPADAEEALERDRARGELLVDAQLFIVLRYPDHTEETWDTGWYRYIDVSLDGPPLKVQLEPFVREKLLENLFGDLLEAGYPGPTLDTDALIAWEIDPRLAEVTNDR